MKKLLLIIVLLASIAGASAVSLDTEHITLLSIIDYGNDTRLGGTADFSLRLQSGSGKIFLESYPATQVDMQVATRLANEYACEYSDVNCERYDFFYTVRSGSPIISGSSGGGAATVLTLAALEDVSIDKGVAMTGAISSGGILAPVAGVAEKIAAAQEEGYTDIIIPYLTLESTVDNLSNLTNESELLSEEQLAAFTTDVHALMTIPEAFEVATGRSLEINDEVLTPPPAYERTMQKTANALCQRTEMLFGRVDVAVNNSDHASAVRFFNLSRQHNNSPYTRASYCFSANLPLQRLVVENFTQPVLLENVNRLGAAVDSYRNRIEAREIVSFTDLEAYMIVIERLLEAEETLADLNQSNISSDRFAYAVERYESAVAWASFFGTDRQAVVINDNVVAAACAEELQSVETRMSYLRTILPPGFLSVVDDNLAKAYEYRDDGAYELCLFKASKAKAHANIFFSTLAAHEDQLSLMTEAKHRAAFQVMHRQQPVFPMLGYSYTEYSQALQGDDAYSSVLFSEYGLVFSDVSGYFPPQRSYSLFASSRDLRYFAAGFLIGFLVMLIIWLLKRSP